MQTEKKVLKTREDGYVMLRNEAVALVHDRERGWECIVCVYLKTIFSNFRSLTSCVCAYFCVCGCS